MAWALVCHSHWQWGIEQQVVRGKAAAAVYNGPVRATLATSSAERNNVVQTVDRALQMLAAFTADGQLLRITDFTALLGVHKSTVSRLAATLDAHGFLERVPSGEAFRLGPEVTRLGLLALCGRNLVLLLRVDGSALTLEIVKP